MTNSALELVSSSAGLVKNYTFQIVYLLFYRFVQMLIYYTELVFKRILHYLPEQLDWLIQPFSSNPNFDNDVSYYIVDSKHYYDPPYLDPYLSTKLMQFKKKTLVLDLDETLIYSETDDLIYTCTKKPKSNISIWFSYHNRLFKFTLYKRPHVDFFLKTVSQWYDLVSFTASIETYGNAVVDFLENGNNYFKKRLFRQHCTISLTGYEKDLTTITTDLSSIIIIDNTLDCFRRFMDNGLHISSWDYNKPNDTELIDLLPILDCLRFVSDVRLVLKQQD